MGIFHLIYKNVFSYLPLSEAAWLWTLGKGWGLILPPLIACCMAVCLLCCLWANLCFLHKFRYWNSRPWSLRMWLSLEIWYLKRYYIKMMLLGWALTRYDRCPDKKRKFEHRHLQRWDSMKRYGEIFIYKPREKINPCCLSQSVILC